jgi:predicted negative regulator of RcsB-dependent stress response
LADFIYQIKLEQGGAEMVDHLSEEEQVEALKKWWKENGVAIFIGVVIGLGAVIGVRYWYSYQETRSIAASDVYNRFTESVQKNEEANTQKLANEMLQKYKGTSYAALTALQLAKQNVDANKLAEAEKNLRWALDNPGDKSIALITRQRLAEVLSAEGKLDEALSVLDKVKDPTFDPLFAQVRGDILRKQGKLEKAREAYQLALTDPSLSAKQREFIEMKLEELPKLPVQDAKK